MLHLFSALCSKKTRSPDALSLASQEHDLHVEEHVRERASFAERRQVCEQSLGSSNVLLYDYTRVLSIPDVISKPSVLRRLVGMPIQIGGLMSFGTRVSYLFAHHAAWPRGGNVICTLLFHTVYAIYTGSGVQASSRFLQLQCDGGSENINRTVLTLCCLFVSWGWSSELTIHRIALLINFFTLPLCCLSLTFHRVPWNCDQSLLRKGILFSSSLYLVFDVARWYAAEKHNRLERKEVASPEE